MYKRILPVVAVLALFGCDQPPKEQHTRTDIKLNVMLFDTPDELNQYIHSNYEVSKVEREGFSAWYENDPSNECTIFVLKGAKSRNERTYGHEIMHCIYGTFHEEI